MTTYDDRPRGTTVWPMPEEIAGPFDDYALVLKVNGDITEARMVHTQGVAYLVTAEKPWRWSDYLPDCPTFTVAELVAAAVRTNPNEGVDLADWVHTFGARLESNFAQIHHWANA